MWTAKHNKFIKTNEGKEFEEILKGPVIQSPQNLKSKRFSILQDDSCFAPSNQLNITFKTRSKSIAKPTPNLNQTVTMFQSRNNPDLLNLATSNEFYHLNNTKMNFHLPKLRDSNFQNKRIRSLNQTMQQNTPLRQTKERLIQQQNSENITLSAFPSRT